MKDSIELGVVAVPRNILGHPLIGASDISPCLTPGLTALMSIIIGQKKAGSFPR